MSIGASWATATAMMTRGVIRAAVMGLLLTTGCNKNGVDSNESTPPPSSTPSSTPPSPTTDRPAMTNAECESKGGRVVGDIGDGAIHRPDYTCESGKPPLGSIRAVEGEPIPIEGAVCCPTS